MTAPAGWGPRTAVAGILHASPGFPTSTKARTQMADTTDTMMNPGIEELLDRAGSKFSLVAVASRRARGINTYYSQLGEALSHGVVPPQVTSTAHKPLSIAFEEIADDKIEGVGGATGRPVPEELLPKSETDLEAVLGVETEVDAGTDDRG